MKYYRKPPVEAIQWNWDNQMEVSDFILKVAREATTKNDGFGNLNVCYTDNKNRKHQAVIPMFGWVVIECKTLQFYKDKTFQKTFKTADGNDTVWSSAQEMIDKFEKSFEDMAHSKIVVDHFGAPAIPVRRDFMDAINMEARSANIRNRAQPLADFLHRGCVSRAEAEKQLLGGVTFDSVLDEMKELHAKKNKDYGDSFHKSFVEFGPMAGIARLSDKMERAKSLMENGKAEVKDEGLLDTLKDMSCYAAMLYVELKNQKNDKH